MKTMILAALAVFSLSAAVVPAAHAALGKTQTQSHSGAYDNTGRGPGETGLEGGGE